MKNDKKQQTAQVKELTVRNAEPTLQQMVDIETSNRAILTEFISKHMVRGTDYGSIPFGGRQSKDCLFKPGAEKIGSLLRLRPDVVKDNDTWEMAGSKPGLFCYKCILYNSKNEVVGMGLGACDISEKKNFNNTIKIAKKRAYVDAILTTGALSDFFTQDLEDMGGNGNTGESQAPYTTRQMAEKKEEDGYVREPIEEAAAPVTAPQDYFQNLRDNEIKRDLAALMSKGKIEKDFAGLNKMSRIEMIVLLQKAA